jgi:hypothetical protein
VWSDFGGEVLLAVPQGRLDLSLAAFAAESGIPTILWLMDDYWRDTPDRRRLESLWKLSRARFVVSGPMGDAMERRFGGSSTILNNAVTLPPAKPRLPPPGTQLRIAYVGALNYYYKAVAHAAGRELRLAAHDVIIDVFSHERPVTESSGWRYMKQVSLEHVQQALIGYDAVLLLSSFSERDRPIAETSLASKIADYTAAARPIVSFGPEYSANTGEVRRFGLGPAVTSAEPGSLAGTLRDFAQAYAARAAFSQASWEYAMTYRDLELQKERFWVALNHVASGVQPV